MNLRDRLVGEMSGQYETLLREVTLLRVAAHDALVPMANTSFNMLANASELMGPLGDFLGRHKRLATVFEILVPLTVALSSCNPTQAPEATPITMQSLPPNESTIPAITATLPASEKTPIPTSTKVVVTGFGGQMSKEQAACVASERGKEMEQAYRSWVGGYWSDVGYFGKNAEISFKPIMDEAYPDDPNKCLIVMESNSFPGRVFTIPIAQVRAYLATGNPEEMLPPQGATTLQPFTDAFMWYSEVSEESEAYKAGVPLGSRWVWLNGEIVYVTGRGADIKVVGGLDGKDRWEVVGEAKYSPDQLATMTPDQMIAAANASVQLPEGATLENTDIRVEAGHVVTYSQDGEHVAVLDLLTGETHDQMGVIEYGGGIYQRVFFDNNWDYEGYTPSLEERGMLKEQIATMVEGEFAVNWALREGLYSSDGQSVRITGGDPLSLNTTAKRLAFFNNVILPKYRAAVASGAIFQGGSVIPLDGGLQFRTQLPEVVVEFEYNPENSTSISQFNGKEGINVRDYDWVTQSFDKDNNTLTITIGMDAKLARMSQEQLVGGAILGSLRSVAFDDLTEAGIGDMSAMPMLDAMGVTNLGPNRESNRYGSLSPSTIVLQVFEGLEPIMHNRKK